MKQARKFLSYMFLTIAVLFITIIALQMINGHLVEDIGWRHFLLTILKVSLKTILTFILSFMAFFVITRLGIIIAGVLSGYKFLGIGCLGLSLKKQKGKYKLRTNSDFNEVLLGLPLTQDESKKYPYVWYNISLFIICLAIIIFSIYLIFRLYNPESENNIFMLAFFIVLIFQSLIIVLSELITLFNPTKYTTGYGLATALMISKDEHVRHVYFLSYQANTFVCEGYTFTQGPPYLFEDVPVDIYSLELDKGYRIMYCEHLIWEEDYEQALIALGDKESYDIKKMRELCLSDMLYAELFTYRRLDVIYSLYQELTEKGLRDLYSYGTLYAMNRLFFKNEAAAKKIKKRFEKHNYFFETDKDKETRMFNLVDELYASGQYSEVYFKKPSKKLDQNTMNTYYIITILCIFVAAFLHYGIEGGINKYKQDINTANNSLKLEMSEALKQNDCHRLKRVLMMDEYFENNLKDKPVDDNSYYILKKQCQERISELDCDVDIQSSESNL